MNSNSRTTSLLQHRRGHSTGSMTASKTRDDNLALFHEMQARERNNFLYPNTDDIEVSLSTKFGGISGYRSPRHRGGSNDLLGIEHEKNDYDWLLTPPGTPLFPSLDAPPNPEIDIKALANSSRPRSTRSARTSPSPKRPSSPSLTRRASSPSRSSTASRPATPPGRPSTPGRTSTPTRRSLTPSSSFNSTSSTKSVPTNTGRTARSSSPSSRKPKTVVHPAMPAFSSEPPPPNLRTTMLDRPTSNPRGASVSPRGGTSLKTSQISDPGDVGGRNRRAVSPGFSRSYSSSSSKGSVVSSGFEVNRPKTIRSGTDSTGKRPISRHEETSPVKPQAKKTLRTPGVTSSFSSRKPFENSTRQTEFRRASTTGFRPLMSNSHISTFYSRTSSFHRPSQSSITDSSINSSAASIHESEHDDEASSRNTERCGKVGDMETTEPAKPLSELHSIDEPVEMDWSRTPDRVTVQNVDSILDLVLDRVLGLAESRAEAHRHSEASVSAIGTLDVRQAHRQVVPVDRKEENLPALDGRPVVIPEDPEALDARLADKQLVLEELSNRKEVRALDSRPVDIQDSSTKEADLQALDSRPADRQVVLAEVSNRKEAADTQHHFSLSCSSMEVYQFDQELTSTCSEVDNIVPESPGTAPPTDNTVSTSGVGLETKETPFNRPSAKPSRSKAPFRDSSAGFGAKHYLSARKKDSRESNSSLFSIPMWSSKGDSFSSGRPTSIDTQSTSSNYRYDDTKSEESCVDYYIVEPNKHDKQESRMDISRNLSKLQHQHKAESFDADEGYVDCYIDQSSQAENKNVGDFRTTIEDVILKTASPEQEGTAGFVEDHPHIEVCSMDESSSDSGNGVTPDVDMVITHQRNEQGYEDMDCDEEEPRPDDSTSQSKESMECSQTVPPSGNTTYSTDNIRLCNSIVQDIICKAATLGIEKEDLKALATRASADDLVTFLGLPKSMSGGTKQWNVPQESSTTVRQRLAYMQNQKMMQNTTVAYMQRDTLGRVQEDVKKDQYQFVKQLASKNGDQVAQQRKPKSNKCRCTIL